MIRASPAGSRSVNRPAASVSAGGGRPHVRGLLVPRQRVGRRPHGDAGHRLAVVVQHPAGHPLAVDQLQVAAGDHSAGVGRHVREGVGGPIVGQVLIPPPACLRLQVDSERAAAELRERVGAVGSGVDRLRLPVAAERRGHHADVGHGPAGRAEGDPATQRGRPVQLDGHGRVGLVSQVDVAITADVERVELGVPRVGRVERHLGTAWQAGERAPAAGVGRLRERRPAEVGRDQALWRPVRIGPNGVHDVDRNPGRGAAIGRGERDRQRGRQGQRDPHGLSRAQADDLGSGHAEAVGPGEQGADAEVRQRPDVERAAAVAAGRPSASHPGPASARARPGSTGRG